MCQLSGKDVAEDLGIAMRMRREAGLGSDAVFVQHAQTAKGLKGGVGIGGEGKSMVGV